MDAEATADGMLERVEFRGAAARQASQCRTGKLGLRNLTKKARRAAAPRDENETTTARECGPARPLARPAGFAPRKVPSLCSAHFEAAVGSGGASSSAKAMEDGAEPRWICPSLFLA